MHLVVALLAAAPLKAVAAPPSHADARRVLVRAGCAKCHDSVVSKATPAALAVYDLQETRWSAPMTDEQLPKLMGRLKSAPKKDRDLVAAFIESELRGRRGE